MPRTTTTAVQDVLTAGGDYNGTTALDPHITRANIIVNRVAQMEADDEVVSDEAALTEMETYLACHFYCVSDRVYMSRSNNGASGSFAGQMGKYLEFTPYGQAALTFDFNGELYLLMQQDKSNLEATGFWLGTPAASQPDYPR